MIGTMNPPSSGRPRPRITPASEDGFGHDESLESHWTPSFIPNDTHDPDENADYWNRVEIDGVNFPIWVRFGQTEFGEFVVTGMLLGDAQGRAAIGTGGLNKIAVNDIISSAESIAQTDGRLIEHARDFIGKAPTPGGQPQGEEVFREAAHAWALAKLLGKTALVTTVAEMLGVSRPTASRRIQRARDEGLLADELENLGSKSRQQLEQHARDAGFGHDVLALPPF